MSRKPSLPPLDEARTSLLVIPPPLPFQSLGEMNHLFCLAFQLKLLSLPGGCLHGESTTPHSPDCLPGTQSQKLTPLFLLQNTKQQSLSHVKAAALWSETSSSLWADDIPIAQTFSFLLNHPLNANAEKMHGFRENQSLCGRNICSNKKCVSKSSDNGTLLSEGQPFS